MEQYSVFILTEDLNSVVKKGMHGVVLEIYDDSNFECEFLDEDGTNLEFEGNSTFTVKSNICEFKLKE